MAAGDTAQNGIYSVRVRDRINGASWVETTVHGIGAAVDAACSFGDPDGKRSSDAQRRACSEAVRTHFEIHGPLADQIECWSSARHNVYIVRAYGARLATLDN